MSNGGMFSARLISAGSLQRVHVGAGTERTPGARQHDDTDVIVDRRSRHRIAHVVLHDRRPRVHAVGPIERDGRDLIAHLVKNLLIGHPRSPWMRCREGQRFFSSRQGEL
jgi:hypothetical protein